MCKDALDVVTCARYGVQQLCSPLLCPTCPLARQCDRTCGFCPGCANARADKDCNQLRQIGYCSTLFCPTCPFRGKCDKACGFCFPGLAGDTKAKATDDGGGSIGGGSGSGSGRESGSGDAGGGSEGGRERGGGEVHGDLANTRFRRSGNADGASSSDNAPLAESLTVRPHCANYNAMGDYVCNDYAKRGYCAASFCTNCTSAGQCNKACGLCTPCGNTIGDGNCRSYRQNGFCRAQFCPTCEHRGMCDLACGYCTTLLQLQIGMIPIARPAAAVAATDAAVAAQVAAQHPPSTGFAVYDEEAAARAAAAGRMIASKARERTEASDEAVGFGSVAGSTASLKASYLADTASPAASSSSLLSPAAAEAAAAVAAAEAAAVTAAAGGGHAALRFRETSNASPHPSSLRRGGSYGELSHNGDAAVATESDRGGHRSGAGDKGTVSTDGGGWIVRRAPIASDGDNGDDIKASDLVDFD